MKTSSRGLELNGEKSLTPSSDDRNQKDKVM